MASEIDENCQSVTDKTSENTRVKYSKICESLDEVCLDTLQTIADILQVRSELEIRQKEGYMWMAKSRYSMGSQSVSISQLPTEDTHSFIEAKIKVSFEDDQFCKVNGTESGETDKQELRNVTNRMRGTKLDDSTELIELNHQKSFDPLNWFGVLVPQSLRSCQLNFQQAVGTICHLATLQLKLIRLRQTKLDLFQQKKELKLSLGIAED